MKFLANHGEKLLCTVIVAFCAAWIFERLVRDEPAGKSELYELERRVLSRDDGGALPASYPYHPSRLAPYAAALASTLERSAQHVERAPVAYTFYPQPDRPVIRPPTTTTPGPVIPAVLPAFEGLSVAGQQGKVLVSCRAPQQPEYFVPLRIEVLRGTSPDRIDQIVHQFALNPDKATARTEATPEPRRRPPIPPQGSGKDTAVQQFEDIAKPQVPVYYRARLIARLTAPEPNHTVIVNGQVAEIHVPESIERIQDATGAGILYASPWSPVLQATVPSNIQLRYQCVTGGELPVAPRAPAKGYSAVLGVRLWDPEAQAWGESSLTVAAGQPIKGRLKFRVGAATKFREFETGLILHAVRAATKVRLERKPELVTEPQTDEHGAIVQVPVQWPDGRFKTVERQTVLRIPTEIAILTSEQAAPEVRLIKGLGYEEALPGDVELTLE